MLHTLHGVALPGSGQHVSDQAGREQGLGDRVVQVTSQSLALLEHGRLPGALVKPRILNRQSGLIRERGCQLDVLSHKARRLAAVQSKSAERLLRHGKRYSQYRAITAGQVIEPSVGSRARVRRRWAADLQHFQVTRAVSQVRLRAHLIKLRHGGQQVGNGDRPPSQRCQTRRR